MVEIAELFTELGANVFLIAFLAIENRRLRADRDATDAKFLDLFKEVAALRERRDR